MSRAKPLPGEPTALTAGLYKTLGSSRAQQGKPALLLRCVLRPQRSRSRRARGPERPNGSRTRRLRAVQERRRARAARGSPPAWRPPGAALCPGPLRARDTCCRAGARSPGHRLGLRGVTGPGSARRTRPPRRPRCAATAQPDRPPAGAKPPLRGLSRPSPLRAAAGTRCRDPPPLHRKSPAPGMLPRVPTRCPGGAAEARPVPRTERARPHSSGRAAAAAAAARK